MGLNADTDRSEWQGFAISGQGVRFQADWGTAAASRSDGAQVDPLAAALGRHGMETVAATTLTGLELTGIGSRGSAGDGSLSVDLGRPDPDEPVVVLVEEQGQYTWVVPGRGDASVEIPLEAGGGSRGLPGPLRRIVRFVAVKTAGRVVRHATRTLVGGWDEHHHPYRLRTWTPEDHRSSDAPEPDLDAMVGAPSLLVIHGFTGSVHGSFALESDVVDGIFRAYGGRTFAFDHPTLVASPRENATWLAEQLPANLTVDVIAHSRGGLVARELARLAKARGVTVRSITFVATPNDGTPLAEPTRALGMIDAVTNLAGAVPGAGAVELALELLKDVVIESALDALPGLMAMRPGGEYLAALNTPQPNGGPTLRAICADYEPMLDAGIVKTARNRLLDRYFGGVRNDRIVPTLSTIVTSGAFRVPVGQRLLLDSSRAVDHSTFWTNERVVRQLRDWLRPDWVDKPPAPILDAETEPFAEVALPPDVGRIGDLAKAVKELPASARRGLEQLIGGPVHEQATPPTGGRPAVVLIPGIMGTHLARRADRALIWIDPLRLARGHFADLALPAPAAVGDIEPAGLHGTYLPLITRLAAFSDVYLAPFDWRADIRSSARHLAVTVGGILDDHPKHEVHMVAHSMGGLVARAMALVAKDVWDALGEERAGTRGRLVMLGTPNGGSFSIPLLLTGAERTLSALAAVDLRGRKEALARVVASFPGVYQMLPFAGPDDDHHALLFDPATWGSATRVDPSLLQDGKAFHEELRHVIDPGRMVCVAGYGHATPYRLEVEAPGKFRVGRFTRGDGRVAIPLAGLKGAPGEVRTFFSRATHGGLPSDPKVLAAIEDLLKHGDTKELESEEPVRRGDRLGTPVMIPADEFDQAPAAFASRGGVERGDWRDAELRLGEALRLTLGGGAPSPHRPVVEVHVLNASLEQAWYPVVVGHYARLPQDGAEKFLDAKMGGALRVRQRLGQYPDSAASALYVAAPKNHRPRGAIVLGLGELGTLTSPTLATAMMQGVLAYALEEGERLGPGQPAPALGVSAVLVGTPGRRGLTVDQSVAALLEGVIRAVVRLNEPGHAGHVAPVERVTLQIVELFEETAEEAALAVDRLEDSLAKELLRHVQLSADPIVREGDGHMAGSSPRAWTGTPWVRVTASLAEHTGTGPPPPIRRMTFAALSRGAQANLMDHDLDLDKIRAYVQAAVAQGGRDQSVSRTLYELVFPHRAKFDLDRTESLHLLVDEEMAEIPWELLSAGALQSDVMPLALRGGMLRQLQSGVHTRERGERPTDRGVLVVGDPPTHLPRLPGARDEAIRVADLFEDRGWTVVRRTYGSDDHPDHHHWMRMLDALNAHPYRAVHIAAHGIFEESDENRQRSGVVIGPEPHHRITALDFKQMTVTPDLVFLNCCHLGRLGSFLHDEPAESRRAFEQPHRFAATVAGQLLRNGVGAVVVAGWAVDDGAANAFATRLYTSMLDGHPFGEAVRLARQAAKEADWGRSTTWGAYQCYGDPDFGLGIDEQPKAPRSCLVSPAQLARHLEEQAIRAGNAISPTEKKAVADRVVRLRDEGGRFLEDGRVLESLGKALSELGDDDGAVKAYEQALSDGLSHLWVAEQLASLQTRLAVRRARAFTSGELGEDGSDALFEEALAGLTRLDGLGFTAERWAIRGSVHKKRATTKSEEAARKQDLQEAYRCYEEARKLKPNGYHTNMSLQTGALVGALPDGAKKMLDSHFHAVTEREEKSPSVDYWEVAAVADILVTYAVLGERPPGDTLTEADVLKQAEAKYTAAFVLRSTVRQRESAIEHLEDLSRLLPATRAAGYRTLLASLKKVGVAVSAG